MRHPTSNHRLLRFWRNAINSIKKNVFSPLSLAYSNSSILKIRLNQYKVEEAIEPTYQLALNASDPNPRSVGGALDGLTLHRNKKSVDYLIGLMNILPRKHGARGKELARLIDVRILPYAKMTTPTLGPVPDTLEQWHEWWQEANILFDDNMQLLNEGEPKKSYADTAFATDLKQLKLITTVDSQAYRPGDPIRFDIVFKNTANQPFKIVFPDTRYSTMGWGIKLNRTGKKPLSILEVKLSSFYFGSYSSPPPFRILDSEQDFRDSVCLQHWLQYKNIWPLSEGTYEMAVSFDSSQFYGIKPEGPERTGLWTSSPVRFKVSGNAMEDPDAILELIGKKTNKKWLRTDLTSRRGSRNEEAWRTVYEYGDARLVPMLEKLVGQDVMTRSLRSFSKGSENSAGSQQDAAADANKRRVNFKLRSQGN